MLQPKPDGIKIQIAPTRRIEDLLTVWHENGEEVDIKMDVRGPYSFNFRPGSVKVLYCFGILGQTDPDRVEETIRSLYKALCRDGELYVIEPDFDYLTRAAVGGDIPPKNFSKDFTRKSYFSLQSIAELFNKLGIPNERQIIWYDSTGLKFEKHHYEMILSGRKPNE